MIVELPVSARRNALIPAALFLLLCPIAFADCPKTQRNVGWISEAPGGVVSVERSGEIHSLVEGGPICTSDRVIALNGPVSVKMKCEGERTVASGDDLQIGTRTWYTNWCITKNWSALFAHEKRDAAARAVTLSPQGFAFAIAGLEDGSASLEKIPKTLKIPVSSLMFETVSARLVAPNGKVYDARREGESERVRLIFTKLKSAPGEWAIEVTAGRDILLGSFTVSSDGARLTRKRSVESLLADACGQAGKRSLAIYNSAQPEDEPMLHDILQFWSSPGSDSLCAVD